MTSVTKDILPTELPQVRQKTSVYVERFKLASGSKITLEVGSLGLRKRVTLVGKTNFVKVNSFFRLPRSNIYSAVRKRILKISVAKHHWGEQQNLRLKTIGKNEQLIDK